MCGILRTAGGQIVHEYALGRQRLGLTEGWMPVFNRDPALSWDAKLTWRTLESEGKKIHVVGL